MDVFQCFVCIHYCLQFDVMCCANSLKCSAGTRKELDRMFLVLFAEAHMYIKLVLYFCVILGMVDVASRLWLQGTSSLRADALSNQDYWSACLADYCLLQWPQVLPLSLSYHPHVLHHCRLLYIYIHINIIHGECWHTELHNIAIYQWTIILHIIFLQTNVNMYSHKPYIYSPLWSEGRLNSVVSLNDDS